MRSYYLSMRIVFTAIRQLPDRGYNNRTTLGKSVADRSGSRAGAFRHGPARARRSRRNYLVSIPSTWWCRKF